MSKPVASSEWIYGFHAVSAVLNQTPQRIEQLIWVETRQDQRIKTILEQASVRGIPNLSMTSQQLTETVASSNHQGIAAACSANTALTDAQLPGFLDALDPSQALALLVLDQITDPHNLGACLRSAEAAGITAVFLPKHCSAPLNATVKKVASGALATLPVFVLNNLSKTLSYLKTQGFWIYGLSDQAHMDLFAIDFPKKTVLILGSEQKGMRRLTEEHCDYLLKIPMHGALSSLNVSVASGIAVYAWTRQRSG